MKYVIATAGGIVEVRELVVPANAHVVPFADHDALMRGATMVVGHGGHGTTMRALRHGLPIVGMPAKGADQVPITRLLEEWNVGRALPGDADVARIRAAVEAFSGISRRTRRHERERSRASTERSSSRTHSNRSCP